MADMSNAEVALLTERGDGMFNGNSAFFWIFALLILAGGGFGNGWGGNGGYVTHMKRPVLSASRRIRCSSRTTPTLSTQFRDSTRST